MVSFAKIMYNVVRKLPQSVGSTRKKALVTEQLKLMGKQGQAYTPVTSACPQAIKNIDAYKKAFSAKEPPLFGAGSDSIKKAFTSKELPLFGAGSDSIKKALTSEELPLFGGGSDTIKKALV